MSDVKLDTQQMDRSSHNVNSASPGGKTSAVLSYAYATSTESKHFSIAHFTDTTYCKLQSTTKLNSWSDVEVLFSCRLVYAVPSSSSTEQSCTQDIIILIIQHAQVSVHKN